MSAASIATAKSTRDVAIMAMQKIDDHVVECTRVTKDQNDAIESVHGDVKKILWSTLALALAVVGFFIKAQFFHT